MKTAKMLAESQNDPGRVHARQHAYASLKKNERLVLDQLVGSNRPMKAYEILQPLHAQGIRAPMTVYRALEKLVELKLVKRVSCLNAYQFLGFAERNHFSAFLICRHCLKTRIIALERTAFEQLFGRERICEKDTTIELMTDCQGCLDASGDPDGR